MTDQEANAARVAAELDAPAGQRYPLALHRRLAALVGDDEIAFCDHDLAWDRELFGGTVLLFTSDRLVVATVDGLPDLRGIDRADTSAVSVRTRARRDLTEVALLGDVDAQVNGDYAWQSTPWPSSARVTLTYAAEQHTLPLASNPELHHQSALRAFLPSLCADLTRTR